MLATMFSILVIEKIIQIIVSALNRNEWLKFLYQSFDNFCFYLHSIAYPMYFQINYIGMGLRHFHCWIVSNSISIVHYIYFIISTAVTTNIPFLSILQQLIVSTQEYYGFPFLLVLTILPMMPTERIKEVAGVLISLDPFET